MFLPRIHRLLHAQSKGKLFLLALSLEALIALLDKLTGPYLSFDPYYLIPIAIATWYLSSAIAYGAALTSAAIRTWVTVEIFPAHLGVIYVVYAVMVEAFIFLLAVILLKELRRTFDHLSALNARDELTGLASRASFLDLCSAEIARTRRSRVPLALAFADLDNFKLVNDLEGHVRGDELLVAVAHAIKAAIRDGDVAGRVGGDEFAFLLPNTRHDQLDLVLGRLRDSVSTAFKSSAVPVGISIGAVVYAGDHEVNVDELMAQADTEMYKTKRSNKAAGHVASLTGHR